MTEFEKMRNGELYDFSNEQGMKSIEHANRLCTRLQTMTLFDEDYRQVMEELIPGFPASSTICPPFHCDHGHGIKIGENVFINSKGDQDQDSCRADSGLHLSIENKDDRI